MKTDLSVLSIHCCHRSHCKSRSCLHTDSISSARLAPPSGCLELLGESLCNGIISIKRIAVVLYLCESLSVISSCLTEEDFVVAASVTRAASSRRPAAFSMEAAARSSKTIDAAAFAVVPLFGEEEDMSIVSVSCHKKSCLQLLLTLLSVLDFTKIRFRESCSVVNQNLGVYSTRYIEKLTFQSSYFLPLAVFY